METKRILQKNKAENYNWSPLDSNCFHEKSCLLGIPWLYPSCQHTVQIVQKSPLLVTLRLEILSLKVFFFFSILINVDMSKVFNDHR